jgi:DNA-binding response OmpR family regulator
VEDNPADVGLVRMALEEHGVKGFLFVVGDGETAIQLVEDLDAQRIECPDLAIIDLNLPRRPGREVLERMNRSARCQQIPFRVLSSSDVVSDRADAARLGARRYLRKPSRLIDFLNLGAVFKAVLAGTAE